MRSNLAEATTIRAGGRITLSEAGPVIAWLGSLLAVSGSLLLALRLDVSGWGWVLFTVSSLALFTWSLIERHTHQAMMQGVFLCTNLLGVYRWLIAG